MISQQLITFLLHILRRHLEMHNGENPVWSHRLPSWSQSSPHSLPPPFRPLFRKPHNFCFSVPVVFISSAKLVFASFRSNWCLQAASKDISESRGRSLNGRRPRFLWWLWTFCPRLVKHFMRLWTFCRQIVYHFILFWTFCRQIVKHFIWTFCKTFYGFINILPPVKSCFMFFYEIFTAPC